VPFRIKKIRVITLAVRSIFRGYLIKIAKKTLLLLESVDTAHRFTPPTGPTNVRVPTALERTGDFSQSRDNNGNLFPFIKDFTLNLPCSATNTTGLF